MKQIRPIHQTLLIELKGGYEHLDTTEEKFGSYTEGDVKAIAADAADEAKELGIEIGSRVYFAKYEDTAPIDHEGKKHILLGIDNIAGVAEWPNGSK